MSTINNDIIYIFYVATNNVTAIASRQQFMSCPLLTLTVDSEIDPLRASCIFHSFSGNKLLPLKPPKYPANICKNKFSYSLLLPIKYLSYYLIPSLPKKFLFRALSTQSMILYGSMIPPK